MPDVRRLTGRVRSGRASSAALGASQRRPPMSSASTRPFAASIARGELPAYRREAARERYGSKLAWRSASGHRMAEAVY